MIPSEYYALSTWSCVLGNQLALEIRCRWINKHPLGAQAWLVSMVLNHIRHPRALIRCSCIRCWGLECHTCAYTQLSSSKEVSTVGSQGKTLVPDRFYNAGFHYNLRPASWSAIWGILITRAVPFDTVSCYQEGVTHSRGPVYRRKEGIACRAQGRRWKLRCRPESVGAPSRGSQVAAAT